MTTYSYVCCWKEDYCEVGYLVREGRLTAGRITESAHLFHSSGIFLCFLRQPLHSFGVMYIHSR